MPLVLRLLILLGIAMLPAVVLQLHFRAEAQAAREATAREGVLRLARLVAADQDSIAEGARQLLTMLGSLAALREGGSPETCSRILGEALREAPRYAELKVIGLDGVVTCSGQPLNLGHDHSERAYFRRALQEDGFVVGDYAIGRGTGLPSLHYAQPFRDAEGRSIGVVAAALDLGWLARRLALAAPPPPGGSVLITDRAATVLARLPDPERHLGKRATGVSGHLGQREVGFDTIPGLDGRPRLMAFAPLSLPGQGLLVAAGIEEPEVLAGLKAANRAGLLMILGGGVMALALAWMTARRFLRAPVAALLATAERWRAGDLAARATSMPALRGEDARSEFGRIALAFDAVADALAERERTMADRETRLRLLADAIPAGIFHFDAERRFRFANAAGMDWLGQPRDTLLGRRLDEVIDAAAYARARPRIERALAGERVSFENRIVPPGGPAPRDLLISYVPQRDADGRIIGFYSLASDITARKAAEAELHESEARFRRIAEAVEDVIGVWEAETGQVLYLSPAYARIFGRPMPALPCANGFWGEAIHPEDRPHVLAAFAAGAGIGFDVEYRILWPDGQERWIRDRAYPLPAVAG
jgi:PAS domain S-box-containing protein